VLFVSRFRVRIRSFAFTTCAQQFATLKLTGLVDMLYTF